ncbi:MAG: type 4a pilus biogenesis protein PilO [Isosphaerales bacterium]
MIQKKAKTDYKRAILEQLRQPLKLRLVLCVAIIAGWYFLFFSPLSEQVAATTAKIASKRKQVTTAGEIEQLRKTLAPYLGHMPAGADINELRRYVIAHMQSSPLKLLDLKPAPPKDLGPYETLGLRLTLEGHFTEIDDLLRWVETDQRFLRIDTIRLDPNSKDPGRLAAQVVLLSLGEKSAATAKAKPEAGKKQ